MRRHHFQVLVLKRLPIRALDAAQLAQYGGILLLCPQVATLGPVVQQAVVAAGGWVNGEQSKQLRLGCAESVSLMSMVSWYLD